MSILPRLLPAAYSGRVVQRGQFPAARHASGSGGDAPMTNPRGYAGCVTSTEETGWPGKRFGAAESGADAVASMGRRVSAFLIDVALAAAVALSFTWPEAPRNLSLVVWAGMTILTVALVGATPGHWALGIRVASVRGGVFVGAWAVPRTVLIFLVIPAVIVDSDGRGLHDKLCRTIVLRSRD